MSQSKSPVEAKKTRPVEYIPPTAEMVEKYAYAVCKQMAQQAGQQTCNMELVRDFTTFLKIIVRMQTNILNRGGQHAI